MSFVKYDIVRVMNVCVTRAKINQRYTYKFFNKLPLVVLEKLAQQNPHSQQSKQCRYSCNGKKTLLKSFFLCLRLFSMFLWILV